MGMALKSLKLPAAKGRKGNWRWPRATFQIESCCGLPPGAPANCLLRGSCNIDKLSFGGRPERISKTEHVIKAWLFRCGSPFPVLCIIGSGVRLLGLNLSHGHCLYNLKQVNYPLFGSFSLSIK